MNECKHEELHFGGGAFYIYCSNCKTAWAVKSQSEDNTEVSDATGEYYYRVSQNE